MATPREQLGDLLRKSRIDAGYASHGALARKLNVSRPVVTKIEARASLIGWFEPLLIPGLLQVEPYARAVLAWKPDRASADANLQSRLARQSVLDRAELRVVILESVLYREVGGAATMDEQIQHLLAVGARPSIMLQVVADTTAVAGALGAGSPSRPRAQPTWPRTRSRTSRARFIPIPT